MKPLEEAVEAVLSAVEPVGTESVDLVDAHGRVLGLELIAPEDVPPFANSAMDGYAVVGADVSSPGAVLNVIGELPAGGVGDQRIGHGQAVKIMTGASIPLGADTVVRVEETSAQGDTVTVNTAVTPGTAIRPAAGDIKTGTSVFAMGTRLGAMHIGVLATLGVARPLVFRRPTVAFMSTGDELAPVETKHLQPGMIRDSNRPMLRSLLVEAGVEPIDLGVIPDDSDSLRAALEEASHADAIVTSGGVSMGDYDVTKLVLEGSAGVEFWKVAIQPAKPFAFGHIGDALFFGLPGNPVSAFVSFEQFVRPALLKMSGSKALFRPRTVAVADEDFATDPEKTVFIRVQVTRNVGGRLHVASSGGQSSNVLSAAAAAYALAVVPRGRGDVRVGEDLMLDLIRSPEIREEGSV